MNALFWWLLPGAICSLIGLYAWRAGAYEALVRNTPAWKLALYLVLQIPLLIPFAGVVLMRRFLNALVSGTVDWFFPQDPIVGRPITERELRQIWKQQTPEFRRMRRSNLENELSILDGLEEEERRTS